MLYKIFVYFFIMMLAHFIHIFSCFNFFHALIFIKMFAHRRMSQEEHQAGTPEGKSMAYAVRDLWRGFGVSVRIEQHKTKITR